jgi:phosphomannomutase
VHKTLNDWVAFSGVQFGTSGARGLVSAMTPDVCYAYTQSFLRTVGAGAVEVVIGHDLRPSSPDLAASCIQAVMDAGRKAVFVGALPTPAVAFFASTRKAPSIVITGSHIPFDRNGIKFYRESGEISKTDEQTMLATVVNVPRDLQLQPLPVTHAEASAAYVRRYVSFFGKGALRGMRLAVYEHSSVAREILRAVLRELGAYVLSLGRVDTFVPIDTEAVQPEDAARARQWAAEHRFDAILSTDGDADRPLIGDETGHWLRGDVVGILCAQFLGADAVVTPVSSNTAVEKCGAFRLVLRTRIGSPYVIGGMESVINQESHQRENDSPLVVGYEANGGFLLGSDVVRNGVGMAALPTRDAVLPMLALLAMARTRGCKLSELTFGLPSRFTASDRLQDFPTQDSRALVERLLAESAIASELLAPQSGEVVAINTMDGLRMTFANGDIVHLRPSGNAPELRCYAESESVERASELCRSCLERVRKF